MIGTLHREAKNTSPPPLRPCPTPSVTTDFPYRKVLVIIVKAEGGEEGLDGAGVAHKHREEGLLSPPLRHRLHPRH